MTKSFLLLALLAAPAAADAGLKLTSTRCTVDGAPLMYPDDIMQGGMVVTAKGELVILDGEGKLRRYHLDTKAKGCKLALVATLELGPRASPKRATVDLDRGGTIYVSGPDHPPLRVVDGKLDKPCGATPTVRASPLSDRLWPTGHVDTCDGVVPDLHDWGYEATHLWAVDDRAVVYGKGAKGEYVFVTYGPDGKRAGTVPSPDPDHPWDPERIARCGPSLCAINNAALAVWDPAGKLVAKVPLATLTQLKNSLWPIDLASGGVGTFVLVRDNAYDHDHAHPTRPTWIVRVDGLPH